MINTNITSFGQALRHLRSVANDDGTTKGKLFEKLVKSFLQTDEIYMDRFSTVWLWAEYPDRGDRSDFGIDIVAEERDGSMCAIQCKFYSKKTIVKQDIDSFLEAGSRSEFSSMMLVYTANKYGKKVEEALKGHVCQALNFESLANSNVDWPDLANGITKIKSKPKYELRDDQNEAMNNVINGFDKNDRGQMIMACGTGKTLVSLKIAEKMIGKGGLVLYAVPSISLMHQAIRYWSEQRSIPHGYVGVCSDPKVSHGENTDIPIVEMEVHVTTDVNKIKKKFKRNEEKMTVVFSTYQSMEVIVKAQKKANSKFDLVLCDEAHRTTGIEHDVSSKTGVSNENAKSSFMLVHNNISAKKRLYMTATPKLYRPAAKTKAARVNAKPYSMDDPVMFGNEFYRLDFSNAIDRDLLSDYKVIVLGVDERYGGQALQKLVDTTTDSGDINLTDAARMLGLYRILEDPDKENFVPSLQTAIVYTNRIKDSETFSKTFEKLTLKANPDKEFKCDANHVDGTQNATVRARSLQWLRDSTDNPNECRILSNAECLSEGVDVPSLDAICFMNPKSSQIRIVQAVGRVMRKHSEKKYGYVIIPIGIPPNEKSETVLDNNRVFEMVWNILGAMRSHDNRMNIEANMADLRQKMISNVKIIGIDREGKIREPQDPQSFPLGELDIPADALYSKIVEEVGDRRYLEYWAKSVKDVVERLQERIRIVISNGAANKKFKEFISGLHEIINNSLTEDDGIDMLAQHMVTRRIFNTLFNSEKFAKQNPMSIVLDSTISELQKHGLEAELKDIEGFYKNVENRISGLETHDARQKIITELYGRFFQTAFPKMATRLGVVYTPQEMVDFVLRSVDYVLRENFGRGLTDKNVNIIDPFTGTGTFITRMMSPELGLIRDKDVERKYSNELFANEIILLAYYISAVNCESIYEQRTGRFKPFDGISLTDTFNNANLDDHMDDMMAVPKRRIERQRKATITVVIGNPPYSGGQKSGNEDNPNTSHPEIENRIRMTYASKIPHIKQKRSLFNPYIKAIRWASDRIDSSEGVIGFITPSSWISGNTGAGIRACFKEEFTDIWCFDLGGNVIGADWREEGAKVFGSGSTVGIVITILVKNTQKTKTTIHYKKIKLIEKTEDKHKEIGDIGSIAKISDWQIITPDKGHHWLNPLNEISDDFERYLIIGSDKGKKHKDDKTNEVIFKQFVTGVGTARDNWSYNSSFKNLVDNMKRHTDYYNNADLDNFPTNQTQAKKSDFSIDRLTRLGNKLKFSKRDIRISLYKPFFKQYFHYEPVFIARPRTIPLCFPSGDSENLVIIVSKRPKKRFSAFITDITPDLEVVHHGQCFPLYTYDKSGKRHDNITEYAVKTFKAHYNDSTITRNDIFYYIYGLLHHRGYRNKYQSSFMHGLPHIPMAPDFKAFKKAGKQLAKLHLDYENGLRYKLGKPLSLIPESIKHIKLEKKPDTNFSNLYVDGIKIYDSIPNVQYEVNNYTPIGWFENRYKFNTDKESCNTNYPLEGVKGEDVRAIIERLVHVGVKSDEIIVSLPKEFEPTDWKPKKTGLDLHMNVGGTAQSTL